MPSIICALFCTEKAYKNMQKDFKKNKVKYRELKLIDVGFPLDNENYNKQANYFKTFTFPILKNFFFKIPLLDLMLKKIGLKKFDYETYYKKNELKEYKHRLAYLGLTPLFIDDKYKKQYTKEELKNLKKLYSFETDNYKPKSLKEQGIFSDEDMTFIK